MPRHEQEDALRAYLRRHIDGLGDEDEETVDRIVDEIIEKGTTCVVDGICVIGHTQQAVVEYHALALTIADQVAKQLKAGRGRPGLGERYVAEMKARTPGGEETNPTRMQAAAQERLRQRGLLAAAKEGVEAYVEASGVPVIWDEPTTSVDDARKAGAHG